MSTPVPGTGAKKRPARRRKVKNARTGSVGSKILPGRYSDEGEKGPWFRRLVRRAETRSWRREASRF
ncbi:hypothetical protein ADK41_00035 [Streptomyces caelestis]|jgi:hypothetical protein|uniref:Uncharacterized protein n=1 Tax=Streptomyces caelestis TaxID=36816 RepID=A0A0M8QP03_9ACTN|nr:hypothetical protein ADK41_00035 [Streptomyces caelestis]